MAGPKLGCPPKNKALYRAQKDEERRESGERNAMEGGFGVGKRRYGMGLVKERLKETSEIAIHICILTMNLWRRLKEFLFALLLLVLYGAHDDDCAVTAAWNGNQWRWLFWKPGVAQ
jgi:IS5 family transposase